MYILAYWYVTAVFVSFWLAGSCFGYLSSAPRPQNRTQLTKRKADNEVLHVHGSSSLLDSFIPRSETNSKQQQHVLFVPKAVTAICCIQCPTFFLSAAKTSEPRQTLSGWSSPVSTSLRKQTSASSASLTQRLSTRMSFWAARRGWSSHRSLTGVEGGVEIGWLISFIWC